MSSPTSSEGHGSRRWRLPSPRDADVPRVRRALVGTQRGRFAEKTRKDYRWRLEQHLLPFFAPPARPGHVRRRRAVRRRQAGGSALRQLDQQDGHLLAAVLEAAVERELITRNPAKGKGRRVRERRRAQLPRHGRADPGAAGRSRRTRPRGERERAHVHREAMVAVLARGLRIGELCELRWRAVDLAGGWLHVQDAKTDAGRRRVKLRGALRDELLALKASSGPKGDADAYVFPSRSGGRLSADNVRTRVVGGSVKRANERLSDKDRPPLPEDLAALAAADVRLRPLRDRRGPRDRHGRDGPHRPGFTLRVYRQSMRSDEHEKAARALVDGVELAGIGVRDRNGAGPRKHWRFTPFGCPPPKAK